MNFEVGDYDAMRLALHAMCEYFAGACIPDDTAFDARLIAGELLSNALRHGGGSARLTVEVIGERIRISVKSEKSYRPPVKCPPADVYAEGGRGMFLVDTIASSRSYSEEEGVSVVIEFVHLS